MFRQPQPLAEARVKNPLGRLALEAELSGIGLDGDLHVRLREGFPAGPPLRLARKRAGGSAPGLTAQLRDKGEHGHGEGERGEGEGGAGHGGRVRHRARHGGAAARGRLDGGGRRP